MKNNHQHSFLIYFVFPGAMSVKFLKCFWKSTLLGILTTRTKQPTAKVSNIRTIWWHSSKKDRGYSLTVSIFFKIRPDYNQIIGPWEELKYSGCCCGPGSLGCPTKISVLSLALYSTSEEFGSKGENPQGEKDTELCHRRNVYLDRGKYKLHLYIHCLQIFDELSHGEELSVLHLGTEW